MNYFSMKHVYTFLCSYFLFVGVFLVPLIIIGRRLRDLVKEVKHGALSEKVISRYGFLTIGYEPKYYYWDFVILSRNFILNCVVTIFPVSTAENQRLLIIGIVFSIYLYYF